MGNIITKHSNKLLLKSFKQPTRMCKSGDKASCPMDGNCFQKMLVYQAQADSTNLRKYYVGMFEDEFKTRFNNRTMSFRNRGYEKKTELSKYFWNLKDKGEDFTIKWSVAAKAFPYTCGSKHCAYASWKTCLSLKLIQRHY